MSADARLTAFIFARGGSKGVKDKNIYPVAGKPLIAHSIASALGSRSVARVVVSTDDPRIAQAAKDHGADVLNRPAELAADATPEVLAWRHAVESFPALFAGDDAQPFISLPATSPLRAPEDVDRALARFRQTPCDILFSITPSARNPYLNMVVINKDDLITIAIDGSTAKRRQDVPEMYDITTCVYVAQAAHVLNCARLGTRLIDGRVGYVVIPPERALDIDNHFDLHLAELMLSRPFTPPK
jgi:CMP-N-acetylneuraminic acid synthetase